MVENIREKILTYNWAEEEWKTEGIETQIMANLNLKPQMM